MSKGLYVTSAEDNIVMNHSGIPGNSFLCKFANRIQGAVVFEEFPFEKKNCTVIFSKSTSSHFVSLLTL